MYLFCSEMSTDAGPGFAYTEPAGKMRDEYSSIDVSSETQPSAVRELDDNLRPTIDREGKLPLFFLQLQVCESVCVCVCLFPKREREGGGRGRGKRKLNGSEILFMRVSVR